MEGLLTGAWYKLWSWPQTRGHNSRLQQGQQASSSWPQTTCFCGTAGAWAPFLAERSHVTRQSTMCDTLLLQHAVADWLGLKFCRAHTGWPLCRWPEMKPSCCTVLGPNSMRGANSLCIAGSCTMPCCCRILPICPRCPVAVPRFGHWRLTHENALF